MPSDGVVKPRGRRAPLAMGGGLSVEWIPCPLLPHCQRVHEASQRTWYATPRPGGSGVWHERAQATGAQSAWGASPPRAARAGILAAPGKFEVKRHGALRHSNDAWLLLLTAILPQTLRDLLTVSESAVRRSGLLAAVIAGTPHAAPWWGYVSRFLPAQTGAVPYHP